MKITVERGLIREASFSRVKSKIEKERVPFIMITAFRGNLSNKENRARQKQLEGLVSEAGFSWTKMPGSGYKEDETNVVRENSILIWATSRGGDSLEPTKLFDMAKGLAAAYDQDSFIYGGPKDKLDPESEYKIRLYTPSGVAIDEIWAGGEEGFKELIPVSDTAEYWSNIAGKKAQLKELKGKWESMKADSMFKAMKKQYYVDLLKGMIDGREEG